MNVTTFIKQINNNGTIDLEIIPFTAGNDELDEFFYWKSGNKESLGFETELEAVYNFLASIQDWKFFKDEDECEDEEF